MWYGRIVPQTSARVSLLRVEIENETSQGNFWELRMRMRLLKEIFEGWEWEWEFSQNFLRVENENESSHDKIESWDWEWDSQFFENENHYLRVEIENETLKFSRMRTIIWESRLRMRLSIFWDWEPLFESVEYFAQKFILFL